MTEPRLRGRALYAFRQKDEGWQKYREAQKSIAAALALHTHEPPPDVASHLSGWCNADGRVWPCPTVRALNGGAR